jgi:hypothetical protein
MRASGCRQLQLFGQGWQRPDRCRKARSPNRNERREDQGSWRGILLLRLSRTKSTEFSLDQLLRFHIALCAGIRASSCVSASSMGGTSERMVAVGPVTSGGQAGSDPKPDRWNRFMIVTNQFDVLVERLRRAGGASRAGLQSRAAPRSQSLLRISGRLGIVAARFYADLSAISDDRRSWKSINWRRRRDSNPRYRIHSTTV